MIYVYECTHPDCGCTTERIRPIAQADDPVACPCSQSHDMRRVLFPGGVLGVLRSGATRGAFTAEKAQAIDRKYRATQVSEVARKLKESS